MSRAEKFWLGVFVVAFTVFVFLLAASQLVLAADPPVATAGQGSAQVTCPTAGEPCKILVLTPQEEQLLIKQGGILDSAAAGRYIDLGNVANYFRMKLMQAPAGQIRRDEPHAIPSPTTSPVPEATENKP